jgi:tetratricopeptide (TPR) repeat protein
MSFHLLVVALALNLCVGPSAVSEISYQTKQVKKVKPANEEADAEAAQQRTVAISLVTSLADEARSFKDQTRRARVQARAADVLWDTDPDRARELFRRAWEAAEIVDGESAKKRAEEMKRLEREGGPVVVRGGPDLRSEVLRLVARRDRKLGEEFLKALDEAAEKTRTEAAADQRRNQGSRIGASQRLQLARRLVEDGEVERALEFATPALDSVNQDSIFFLSALREKNAQLADAAYTTLLARAARDPNSDANTVSGLSSYLFTPFLYVTFEPSGGANQSRQRGPTPAPPVEAALRNNFLKVGFQILMQPLAAPDQDRTTSGQTGKYLIIKRLLPLFEQYAADLAPGLRTQMTALASYVPSTFQQGENRAVNVGIQPESSEGDPYQRMQERLDRASKSEERDAIYADYAVAFTGNGDSRARDLVDKIENTELRKSVKAYTDFQLAQLAIRNKDAEEAVRIVKNGDLTSIQKVWALTSAAKLVLAAERSRAADLLEEALAESRRISGSDPDRARALTAVAVGLGEIDRVRAWETLGEVVKAANGADNFTGEDSRISAQLQTKYMVVVSNSTAEDFDLLAVFRNLTHADLFRAIQLAKTFSGEAPRAVATLAIARSVLEKRKDAVAGGN